MRNFNEIFRKEVPYNNIKSHKNPGFYPFFRWYIFQKTKVGWWSNWPTPAVLRLNAMTTINLENALSIRVGRHQFSDFYPTYIFHKTYCARTFKNYSTIFNIKFVKRKNFQKTVIMLHSNPFIRIVVSCSPVSLLKELTPSCKAFK